MAIPKYNEMLPSVLTALADGEIHTMKEVTNFCADAFNLSAEERAEVNKYGETILKNRVGWARTYLKKAGLVDSPERGSIRITEEGKKALDKGAEKIDINYLLQFDAFIEFYKGSPKSKNDDSTTAIVSDLSPQEQIQGAIDELNQSLVDDLMDEVMKMDCYKFESFVIKLLVTMGYGSPLYNENAATKKSGDGGIDGILKADKFGFDSIYIQAKQWKENNVSGPDIDAFMGAMVKNGANKGLFITTSSFSKKAREAVEKNPTIKIVLIDGKDLANLMIEFDIGVSVTEVYKVKKVDSDFFNDYQ